MYRFCDIVIEVWIHRVLYSFSWPFINLLTQIVICLVFFSQVVRLMDDGGLSEVSISAGNGEVLLFNLEPSSKPSG